jgi:hypothetical protein
VIEGEFVPLTKPDDRPKTGDWMHDNAWDLLAAPGTPVLAIGDGVIDPKGVIGFRNQENVIFGHRLTLLMGDGVRAYYSNMGGFAHGIFPGAQVLRGGLLGWVGIWTPDPTKSHLTIALDRGSLFDYLETD